MTKTERLIKAVEELSLIDPSRYHSITEIAKVTKLGPKETQAWLAVLRFRKKIAATLGRDGNYWYAPLDIA